MNREKAFNYLFLLAYAIFFYREIWRHFDRVMPRSFYFPNGIFQLQYANFLMISDFLKVIGLAIIIVGFFKIDLVKNSKAFLISLGAVTLFLLSHRFNYYHFPALEMYPILALCGLLIGRTFSEKIFSAASLVTIVYFFAGVAKLRYSGLDWFDSTKLASMVQYSVHNRRIPFEFFMGAIDAFRPALPILGFLTVVFEILTPLPLFFPALRKTNFFLIVFFHIVVEVVFNIMSSALLVPALVYYFFAFKCADEPGISAIPDQRQISK